MPISVIFVSLLTVTSYHQQTSLNDMLNGTFLYFRTNSKFWYLNWSCNCNALCYGMYFHIRCVKRHRLISSLIRQIPWPRVRPHKLAPEMTLRKSGYYSNCINSIKWWFKMFHWLELWQLDNWEKLKRFQSIVIHFILGSIERLVLLSISERDLLRFFALKNVVYR